MERKDCTYLLEGRNPSRLLEKALAILVHQVTKDDVSRQLKVINEYLIVTKNGFLARDLCNVMRLLELLLKTKLLTEPAFEEPITILLDLCFIPPVLTRSLDLLEFAMDIQEYFSWLGYMIVWVTDKNHQKKIIEAIYTLLNRQCINRCYISLAVRKDKAQQSKLSDILGDLLEVVDEDIYLELLKVVQVIIDGSKQTCIKFLQKGVVSTLIVRLYPAWRKNFPSVKPDVPIGNEEILQTDKIFGILTSLLSHANTEIMRPPSKFSLWSLQWAFRLFTVRETMNVERNNVLAVLLLLMDIYPDLLLGNLTFSYDIAMLAMSRDIAFFNNWTSYVKLTTSHEDHSCMALLLMCISYFPNCLSGAKVIEECRVVMGLMKLIGNQQAIRWQQLQSCYLIRLSLNILHQIVPASTEEFIEDGGPLTILQLLNRARENPQFYSYDIVFRSVELLAHLAAKFRIICDSIAYNGGVACILGLCKDILASDSILKENQTLLQEGIFLLQLISKHNNVLEILPAIISYMKRYVNPDKLEQVQIPRLIIICLSFIWNKVVCSDDTSREFVKMDGAYLLLDIAQIGCLPIKLVALGALIDLAENVECIPYLITWRRNGQGLKALLMEIFRQENKQLIVKTDDNGIILDHLFPLMGEAQYYETYCSCTKHVGNAAIGDMFISCRPKIYCLLQILSNKQIETVEIANDFYKTYDEKLSVIDEVTYVLAENFLALKLGEEWKELRQDFEKLEIVPIPSDKATLHAMAKVADKWGKDLLKIQQEIQKKNKIKERQKEEALYTTLRDCSLADAWDSLREMKYIARCSERLFRVTSNFNLQVQLNECLQAKDLNGRMHRTFQSNVSVTCMRNQFISIPSEIDEDVHSAVKPIIVSPVTSETNISPICDIDEPKGEYLPEEKFIESKCEKQYSPTKLK